MQQFVQQSQVLLPVGGNRLPLPSSRGAFVVNLGSSSTPVALASPGHPELKKFTFFVSRRREDKRERFRLHMGYFDSQQDAEALLEIVREIYPGAWAGIAPGRKAPESVPVPPAAQALAVPFAEPIATPAAPPPMMELQLELEPAPPAPQDEHFAAKESLSSVRAAIASLDDSSAPDESQRVATLSQTQTLKLLESPPASPAPTAPTRAAVRMPVPDSAAAYAVQLRWSNQPIGMSELPPLAIFDAYKLYRAKGRHEGKPWHALRLGFFQDEVSANQVASYILPEFGEATVVPVGVAERDSALAASAPRVAAPAPSAGQKPAPSPAAVGGRDRPVAPARPANAEASSGATDHFKLIEDDTPPRVESNKLEMMLTTDVPAQPVAPAKTTGAVSEKGKSASKEQERIKEKLKARRPPANLEETLDVLGAGNLKLDTAKGEMLDASGVRRMRHAADRKPPARSALTRLFDRLAESIGGGR